MIKSVKFVSITVSDQERSLAFYTEELGFQVATNQPFGESVRRIELKMPGADTRVVIFPPMDDMSKPWRILEHHLPFGRCRGNVQSVPRSWGRIHAGTEERGLGNVGDFQRSGRESVLDLIKAVDAAWRGERTKNRLLCV